MAHQDLFPHIKDELDRGQFHLHTTRRTELALQRELDDLTRKSITEVLINKEAKMKEPKSEAQQIANKLAPEFIPQKIHEKRKSQPVFHEDLNSETAKKVKSDGPAPELAPYNPLDKEASTSKLKIMDQKTKKYPYTRDETITTEEMKKPHVTSLGVVPVRDSVHLTDLNVMLEGRPARANEDPVLGPVQRANTTEIDKLAESSIDEQDNFSDFFTPVSIQLSKPAILSSTGTTQAVTFTVRPPPAPKPMSLSRRSRLRRPVPYGSIQSITSQLPDEAVYKKYDGAISNIDEEEPRTLVEGLSREKSIPDDQRSQTSSITSVKSVKELVDEAKRLSASDVRRTGRRPSQKPPVPKAAKLTKGKSTKKDGKMKGKLSKAETPPSTEKTVDQIIASLKDQSKKGVVSDADRKIQEIMNRVISRTSAVLGDLGMEPIAVDSEGMDEQEREDKTEPSAEEETTTEAAQVTDQPDQTEIEQEELTKEDSVKDGPTDTVPPSVTDTTEEPVLESAEDSERALTSPVSGTQALQDAADQQDISSADKDKEDALIQAWEDLMAPADVTQEDIISVTAKPSQINQREPPVKQPQEKKTGRSVELLSSWGPRQMGVKHGGLPIRTVHHFCKVTNEVQLPDQYKGVWRVYHVPSRFEKTLSALKGTDSLITPVTPQVTMETVKESDQTSEPREREDQSSLSRRQSVAAQRIIQEASQLEEASTRSLEDWKRKAEEVFEQSELEVGGKKLDLKSDESFLYWTPAPPKWDVPPATVKQTLFPHYHGVEVYVQSETSHVPVEESSDSEIEEEPEEVTDEEEKKSRQRLLFGKSPSLRDLTVYVRAKQQRDQDIATGKLKQEDLYKTESEEEKTENESSVTTGSDLYARFSLMGQLSGRKMTPSPTPPIQKPKEQKDILPHFTPLRRAKSAPGLYVNEDEDFLLVYEDYGTVMDEISKQRHQLRDLKHGVKRMPVKKETREEASPDDDQSEEESVREADTKTPEAEFSFFIPKKEPKPTPAESALEAGRAYVILQKKRKKKKRPKKKQTVDMSRIEELERFLTQDPRHLRRSESIEEVKRAVERELRVPQRVRLGTRRSLPDLMDFDSYAKRKDFKSGNMREFVRGIWDHWFEQVYPAPKDDDEEEEYEPPEEDVYGQEERVEKRRASVSSSVYDEGYEDVQPAVEDETDAEVLEMLRDEILSLTKQINNSPQPRAFDLCRRGALLRKLGKVKKALDDLNKAITMEPMMLDAYWHRHLLFLLQNKKQKALDDLNLILKHNKTHADAYKSRAGVFYSMGDVTMAIVNYTQAIKLNPDDPEAYYQRAEMYEKRGELRLAMEDYATSTKLNPSQTDAIFKHGMHYFSNQNWQAAINDFTELLRQDPNNAKAHMFRGRAYSNLQQWTPAVEDLSATIHMDPMCWQALYCRACILRKLHPKRALQDYSMSLLINDSEDNLKSYLHRGILYNDIGRPEDAIPDFEAVLKLDKELACAHVNLGLIYMSKYENYHRAIKKFSAALKVDPTYVRAYVCRGEAYAKLHDVKRALLDFTKAIHLRPDVNHYYMYRGQLVLKMGNLDLAAFCVRHAAELNAGLGQSPTQQAVVQSFLKNYDKAIEALESATKVQPQDSSLWILLGKTRMKAKQWKESSQAFEQALQILKPYGEKEKHAWPAETAEVHFLIGQCQTELRNYLAAFDAFNNTIKADNKFAEAYYQRGLARMRLKQSKGIQDFNRALALDPKIFQVYLSRAAYYGLKGHYTKAILNCNEAIKLQPTSVRAFLYRGALKYHIQAYTLAIKDLTQAAMIDNECAQAYFNRAVCYQDNKQHDKALQDYGIVLLLGDQLNLKVLINRGLLYFTHKDYFNALHDFLAASRVNPTDKSILHTLGLCYHKLGQLQDAVTCFTKALEIDRFFMDALIGRGNVYMDYGEEKGIQYARRDYARVMHMNPAYLPAKVNLAYTLQVAGKFNQAWHQLTSAIALNPRYKPALEGRAIINLQMSNTFAAFQDICASIEVKPTAELLTNRGVINQFMMDNVNAMRDYQKAIRLDATYSLAYFNTGNMYFHTRQFKQALQFYNQAIKYNTQDESAYLNRAITKVLLKDSQGALEDFRTAMKLSPYSAHIYFNRGNLYASLQQLEKAETDYTKALSLQPDDPMVLKRRADVRGKMGQREAAIEDYRVAIEIQSALRRR